MVSQSPSRDGRGVFLCRPKSCLHQVWTGRSRNLATSRTSSCPKMAAGESSGEAPSNQVRILFFAGRLKRNACFQFFEPIRFFRTAFEPGFLHDVSRETLVFQFFEPIHFFLNRMIGRKSHTKRSFSNFFEPIYLFSNRF